MPSYVGVHNSVMLNHKLSHLNYKVLECFVFCTCSFWWPQKHTHAHMHARTHAARTRLRDDTWPQASC